MRGSSTPAPDRDDDARRFDARAERQRRLHLIEALYEQHVRKFTPAAWTSMRICPVPVGLGRIGQHQLVRWPVGTTHDRLHTAVLAKRDAAFLVAQRNPVQRTVFSSVADLERVRGERVGESAWLTVTQS